MMIITNGTLRLTKFQKSANDARKMWIIKPNDKESVIAFEDSKNNIILIDNTDENLEMINNNVFFVNKILGYAMCPKKNADGSETKNYLHEILMRSIDKPSEKHKYVDHINRIKTDNRLCNLRWATQSEQNMNTNKRTRKANARELPDEIKDIELPKYCVYYYDKRTDQHFFTIEKHPNLEPGKRPKTTKSKKISLLDKLEQAKEILKELGASEEEELEKERTKLTEEYNDILEAIKKPFEKTSEQ